MKKIVSIMFMLVAFLLTACQSNELVETREEYYMKLAKEADTYERVYELLEEYSVDPDEQEILKNHLVFVEGNDTVQEALLASEELTPELMINVLKNHKWANIHYTMLRNFLIERISRADLTSEQELDIAYLEVETYQAALLYKSDVSCEALCYILDKDTSKLNLEYWEYQDLICMQATRKWTFEERKKILNTENRVVLEVFSKK